MSNIIDVQDKSKIKIIKPKREVEHYIDNHATLDITRELKDPCAFYDPFGQDTVIDCLTCENCDYKIISPKGQIIRDFHTSLQDKSRETTRYIIEFFDQMPTNEKIVQYLEEDSNDYRITRDSDGVILRFSLEDQRRRREMYDKPRRELEAWYQRQQTLYSEEKPTPPVEKPKTLLKRLKEKAKHFLNT